MTRLMEDPEFLKIHIHTLSDELAMCYELIQYLGDELAMCYELIQYLASCVQRGGPTNWIDSVSAEMRATYEAAMEADDV